MTARAASVPESRVRALVDLPIRRDGRYVLYWMIAARRPRANFALQRALEHALAIGRPLLVFEPLRAGYRWASDRLHRFVIDGMADNARAFARTPVTYLPYVEPQPGDGRGLLEALATDAAVVVTDDYPAFFLPRMVTAAAKRIRTRLEAVDANGLVPMRTPGRCFVTAYSFRAYLQAHLRPHLAEWPAPLDFAGLPRLDELPGPVSTRWRFTPTDDLDAPDRMIAALPIDHGVPMVPTRGGHAAAAAALTRFVDRALAGYTDDRNQPSIAGTSRLSPYLHFGHIGAHEVFNALMTREQWTSRKLAAKGGGAKAGWWGASPAAEAYLDQLITWRELGFNMCVERPDDYDAYASLPNWARATLGAHARDRRQWQYSLDQFSAADTHDAVWNAAQRELTQTGWMHNYLRMLWGKKILEWTRSPDDALHAMVEVMNRFALDGRDPNSYTGYMWTLGRYDRPWAPEREIFGTIRYMSSDNTVRKLKMKPYLAQYGAG